VDPRHPGQGKAVHAVRHDQIGDEQVERLGEQIDVVPVDLHEPRGGGELLNELSAGAATREIAAIVTTSMALREIPKLAQSNI
jgi:CheY-like chemotaxis protein